MKKTMYKALCALLVGSGITAGYMRAQSVPSDPPVINIVKAKHDFGVVNPGVDLVHDFPIKNNGGKDLRITRINISCGCVKDAHIDMDVISGGKTGYLHVVWQPTGGEIASESIEVQSNDPKTPIQEVIVNARVKSSFSISPGVVNYGLVERSALPSTRALEVEKLGEVSEGANLKFESEASYFKTSSTKKGKAKWDLQVVLKPDAPLGPIDNRLVITPNWPGAKPYHVLVLGKVIGDVGADPDEIYVETTDATATIRRSFSIVGEGVRVERVNLRPLDASLKSLVSATVEGEKVNLDFTLPKPLAPNTFRGRILCDVVLSNGKKETVLVPIALVR